MSSQAPALHFRNPNINFLERTISTSGKYMIFLGTHVENGNTCWVVGAVSKITGLITMQHYNTGIKGCLAPRAQAYTSWEKFKHSMTEKAEHEEESYLQELQPYLQQTPRSDKPN